jgi:ribonuclease P protein component
MPATYSYNKKEKLKSRKLLDQLFTKGKSVSAFPLKVFYGVLPAETTETVQAGVGVSARNFSKAVDRNRIKRLLREVYRLNKSVLHEALHAEQKKAAVFFLYVGKEKPEFAPLNETMPLVLQKLIAAIAKS